MVDARSVQSALEQIIADMDAKKHAVAVAHLRDAVDAIVAVEGGSATAYALHEPLVDGASVAPLHRRGLR